ncbi:MAG: LuxR family transcriptional regulator [Firmicutes bacterium]|nr:LuxR family transcriptional regulator [Bacillota bacterium]
MFGEFFFFTYIIAGFVGFLAILLAALMRKYWASGNKQLLAAIRNFMLCTAFIGIMYFYLNYDFLKTGCYTTTAAARVLDSFTFIGQVYFWAAYIREKCQLPQETRKPMFRVTLWLSVFCLLTNLASYGFFMDDYYYVPPGALRVLSIIIEILLMICLAFVTAWHLLKALSELVQKKIRTLVTVISIFITINGLWNAVFSLILMTGTVQPPGDLAMDPTGFLLLLINLFTVLLIYQEDFFALFRIEEAQAGDSRKAKEAETSGKSWEAGQNGGIGKVEQNGEAGTTEKKREPAKADQRAESRETPSPNAPPEQPQANPEIRIKNRLDFIAQSHSLTQREREVLELAYQGMTNPEIADQLIISKYTVKRHMHNIFEKLDISTRMELVHLINSENGPGGPL